jgi:hypothetical protein
MGCYLALNPSLLALTPGLLAHNDCLLALTPSLLAHNHCLFALSTNLLAVNHRILALCQNFLDLSTEIPVLSTDFPGLSTILLDLSTVSQKLSIHRQATNIYFCKFPKLCSQKLVITFSNTSSPSFNCSSVMTNGVSRRMMFPYKPALIIIKPFWWAC